MDNLIKMDNIKKDVRMAPNTKEIMMILKTKGVKMVQECKKVKMVNINRDKMKNSCLLMTQLHNLDTTNKTKIDLHKTQMKDKKKTKTDIKMMTMTKMTMK